MASYPRESVEPRILCTRGRTLYEAGHEKRYLMAFSGKYEIFKYSCSPGFQKYAIGNRFENLDFTTEL